MKITQDELTQIVAEVDKLSRHQETELNREQVKDILRELNLSPDLLDDAIVQMQRRQALARQQRRNIYIGSVIVLTLVGTIILTPVVLQNQQQKLNNIAVYNSQISLSQDQNNDLKQVNRNLGADIFYLVTLQNAPVGRSLSLSCNWIDPKGKIAHQNRYQTRIKNRYQTRIIDKEIWNTYCRYPLGNTSMTEIWKVEMKLGDKTLSRKNFEVK